MAFEQVDLPLVKYWQELIRMDFDESNKLNPTQFAFEMSGIDRGQKAIRRLASYFTLRDKVVLDVGSGNGGICIAAALAGARKVHGLEYMELRIDLARKWAECRNVYIAIQQGVAENMPYPDGDIDIVLMYSVIEHVNSHYDT